MGWRKFWVQLISQYIHLFKLVQIFCYMIKSKKRAARLKYFFQCLFCLLSSTTVLSQESPGSAFKGSWLSVRGKDSIKLEFVNDSNVFVHLGWSYYKMKSPYKYRISQMGGDQILTITSPDKAIKDSIVFTMTRMDQDQYLLKDMYHEFADAPPQKDLFENEKRVLRRQKQ
jgi:hypothetical protein